MIKELRVGNYVAYKGKPSLVCALDYDPKLGTHSIIFVQLILFRIWFIGNIHGCG